MIKFGIIGCGAATQLLHLPALVSLPDVQIDWISDPQKQKLTRIAELLKVERLVSDYREIKGVDAVIIATPHSLHAEMVEHFLENNVHVLCEKPLALSAAEGRHLVEMARKRGLTLAVGVFRRYYHTSDLMRQILETGWLGNLVSIDIEEGGGYDWNLQSTFMLEKDKAGGGVLMDTGAHVVDRILWLVGDESPQFKNYTDNGKGGIESDCELLFSISHESNEVPVRIELSRTRLLRNTFELNFELGAVSVPSNSFSDLRIWDNRLFDEIHGDGKWLVVNAVTNQRQEVDLAFYFLKQIEDFFNAVRTGSKIKNSGESVLPSLAVIEQCYARSRTMDEPWSRVPPGLKNMERALDE